MRRAQRLPSAALAALTLAGCGSGAGTSGGASLTITEGFGERPVLRLDRLRVSGDETATTLVARNSRLVPRGDDRWSLFLNGVAPDASAPAARVRFGDRVWWDRRGAGAVGRTRAVVGSFPEPFRRGIDGKRLPVRVECTETRGAACRRAASRLVSLGVVAATGGLQTSLTMETLRVLVGRWERLRVDPAARVLADGPAASGVYARPAASGRTIAVFDSGGRVTRTLRGGSGLVAAVRLDDAQPVWIVSGTEDRGVLAAAEALTEDMLADHYALAIENGRAISLPDETAPSPVNE